MAACAAVSKKKTTMKQLQSSGDSHRVVLRHVQTGFKEVLAWQRRFHNRFIPNRYSCGDEERKLGNMLAKPLIRRDHLHYLRIVNLDRLVEPTLCRQYAENSYPCCE